MSCEKKTCKTSIGGQAVLEGVATSFPQTEEIIENGIVNGVTATDVQKILNLKHAWEFILDRDVISYPTDYSILCHIAKLVNEGFFRDGGRIRGVPVTIGGTSYIPPMPIESVIKEKIEQRYIDHCADGDLWIGKYASLRNEAYILVKDEYEYPLMIVGGMQ